MRSMRIFAQSLTMNGLLKKLWRLFLLKARYAAASAIATGVDYTLYLLLVNKILGPAGSNIISYSAGVLVNFTLQRWFVFKLERPIKQVFFLAMLVSLGGMALSTGIVHGLSMIPFFNQHQFVTKFCATGIVFFYNFYLKRFAFEKRFV